MDVDLNACLRGDADAWNTFVELCTPTLYRALGRTLSRGGTPPKSEAIYDSLQDVFGRLVADNYRLLRTYDPVRGSLERWLTVVACSAGIDLLRKKKLDFGPLPHPESLPDRKAQPDATPDSQSTVNRTDAVMT